MTVSTYTRAKRGDIMGRLIIDGNSVFEIDEECVKRRRPNVDCDIEKYLNDVNNTSNVEHDKKSDNQRTVE